jgi:hypothetical protein
MRAAPAKNAGIDGGDSSPPFFCSAWQAGLLQQADSASDFRQETTCIAGECPHTGVKETCPSTPHLNRSKQ